MNRPPELVIGTRGSRLALAQAQLVGAALGRENQSSRLVIIETDGDRRAPDTAWGEGAFVATIERSLLAGEIDAAVHSAKDLPTDEDRRLEIGGYLARADPRDALVVRQNSPCRSLAALPVGARVGTDSPRRTAFLLARRPDLKLHPLHGNVDSRLRRLDEGETDALVLACAGLDRLGLGDRIVERLDPGVVPPAPGQGAIAVQVRCDDERTLELVAAIDDRDTRRAVEAERLVLRVTGGGCRAPIGALVTLHGDRLDLLAGYAAPGATPRLAQRRGSVVAVDDLVRDLAAELRASSSQARSASEPARVRPPRVLVTRAAAQAPELISRLRAAGIDPVSVPAIETELEPPGGALDDAARSLHTFGWVVVTSANGARAILAAASRVAAALEFPRWAAVGPVTRGILEREGIEVDLEPRASSALGLAAELPIVEGDRVLLVRGNLADPALPVALRKAGAHVDDIVGYRTREAPVSSETLLRHALMAGPMDAVVFTSGSTVRGLVALADAQPSDVPRFPSICIGPGTAAAARAAGYPVLAVSGSTDSAAIASEASRALGVPRQIR